MVQSHSKLFSKKKMTKKTNSLIFRFGVNILWKNKSVNNKIFSNIIRLENLLQKELKKKNLKVLLINYQNYSVNIYVYNFVYGFNVLKFKIIKHFSKNISLQKVVDIWGISIFYVKWILKDVKLSKTQKSNHIKIKNNKNFSILLLFFNKYVLHFVIKRLKSYNFLIFNKLNWILNCLKSWNFFFIRPNNKKLKNNPKIFLRKINGMIKFKIFSVHLENIIFKFCTIFLNIKLNNVLLKKNLFYNLEYYTQLKKKNFLPIFNTIIFSIIYKNPKLITDYLSIQIKKDKKHKKVLNDFVLILEKIFFSNVIKFEGFKLRLNGKLNGSMRKSRYQYSLGKIELHKIDNYLNFDISLSYTKFGVIAIKSWIINGNNSI